MGWLEKTAVMLALAGILSIGIAAAQPIGVENVTAEASSRFNDTATPTPIDAQAGNVTELSITSISVTKSWQGFYGNITGTIILADASGNNFYDWNVSTPTGQVYASRNDSVTWTDIDCLNATGITAEETYLGQQTTDPDSVNNTYSETNHPSFLVGSGNMTGCPTTQAYSSGGVQNNQFWQVLLADTDDNVVYTTIIEDSSPAGFDGAPWHFQLLVGENGRDTENPTTPYYFYLELQ